MSLHADVAVPARDRRRLERLCRYVARPPLAHERLEVKPDARLALRLKTRWRDGTTHILMERHELLERLTPLVPPPRAHQVRYHGVLAPCASARARIVPGPRPARPETKEPILAANPEPGGMSPGAPQARGCTDDAALRDPGAATRDGGSDDFDAAAGAPMTDGDPWAARRAREPQRAADHRRLPWADLLQRVFEVDALRCPRCGARMRVVSAIEDPAVARKILACLDLPARAPPLGPASDESFGPASGEPFGPAHGSEAWAEHPPWTFDQSPPDSDDPA